MVWANRQAPSSRAWGLARAQHGLVSRRQLRTCETAIGDARRIPVNNLVPTFLDLTANSGVAVVEKAINEADRRELIDPESLRTALDAYPGRSGVAGLRDLLDHRTFRLTDSELERRFSR